MKKATISDVAREAEVSKSTVSRVLNEAPNVNLEMRTRVLDAIERLDYQPSRAARTLKKNLNDIIGFLVPSITDTIFGAVLQGAEDFAYKNKMGILAYSTGDDLERQRMYLETLLSEQLAGLVIVPAPNTDPNTVQTMQAQRVPVVLLDRKLQGVEADYIGSDNIQGAYNAVKHLIDNGYSRIATIAGLQSVSTGRERLVGYRMALSEANLEMNSDWVEFGNFDRYASFAALKSLTELDDLPDAVFVANDEMTVGALHAIKDVGIRIPDDLAFVGFDELPLADLLSPPLTTVEQSTQVLGEEALRILIDSKERSDRPTRIVQLPTKLNVRKSTI